MKRALLLVTILVLCAVAQGAGRARADVVFHSYSPHTAGYDLWAIEASLRADRDALPPGRSHRAVDRALQSLHWALDDVRWTSLGFLVDGRLGDNALASLLTTIGRLTWGIPPELRADEERIVVG